MAGKKLVVPCDDVEPYYTSQTLMELLQSKRRFVNYVELEDIPGVMVGYNPASRESVNNNFVGLDIKGTAVLFRVVNKRRK